MKPGYSPAKGPCRLVRPPRHRKALCQALSAAGEQYIDFRPKTDSGPYLTDGSHITYGSNVKTPQPLSSVLDNLTNLVSQIPPDRFETIVNELDKAFRDGSAPLHTVVTGTSVAAGAVAGGFFREIDRLIERNFLIAAQLAYKG